MNKSSKMSIQFGSHRITYTSKDQILPQYKEFPFTENRMDIKRLTHKVLAARILTQSTVIKHIK